MQIKVYSIDAVKEEKPSPLPGVEIFLKNAAGKMIKPTAAGAKYADLSAGEYEASAAFSGYQPTVKSFRVVCDNPYVSPESFIPEILFLWKSDKPQPVKMASGTFGVKKDNAAADPAKPLVDAVRLAKPAYPPAGKRVRAGGSVGIMVTLNELGEVVDARPAYGHPLLFLPSVKAAFESKFRPTTLQGLPVKVTGIVVYNFVAP